MKQVKQSFFYLAVFILMVVTYVNFMSPLFEYSGFELEFSETRILLGCVLISIYGILPQNSYLSNFHSIIFCLIVIPSLVLYAAGGKSLFFMALTLSAFVIVFVTSFVPLAYVRILEISKVTLIKAFLIMSIAYVIGIILQGGLKFVNFNMLDVYEVRGAAESNLHPVYTYLSPIFGKVIVPVLIILSFIEKKRLFFILGVLLSVSIFGLTSHKSPLIYPIVIWLAYYSISRFRTIVFPLLIMLIVICLLASIDFYMQISSSQGYWGIFGSFLYRRAIFIPSFLNSLYIDFFYSNEFFYWANSKLSFGLVDNNYQLSSAFLIGSVYFGSAEAGANTGWIGSGYSNFGIFGVFIYSFLIGLLLSYLNAASRVIGGPEVFSYSIISLLTIILSADLTTALLTHGLLGLIFVLAIHPRKNKAEF